MRIQTLNKLSQAKAGLKNAFFKKKCLLFFSSEYKIRDKTSTVAFRAWCIAS